MAAFMVFISHCSNQGMVPDVFGNGLGQIGVMLFFALSGFLMYILYGNQPISAASLRAYGLRRFFRVVPAFVAIVLASWLGYRSGWFTLYAIDSGEAWKHLTLRGEVSVLWTIAVELKFYLFFPLVIAVIAIIKSPGAKLVALLSLYVFFVAMEFDLPKSSLWRFTEFFLGGMIAGLMYMQWQINDRAKRWNNAIFVVCLMLLVFSIPRFVDLLPGITTQLWRNPLPYSLLVSVTVLTAAWLSAPIAPIFANPMMRFLGRISFSLYLIHLPVMRWVLTNFDGGEVPGLLVAVAAAITGAWIMYRTIELPGQRIGLSLLRPRH